MEKYGFVYLWYDKKHKRFYIGSHWGTEDDGYICSSRWMRKAYRRRPEDFKRRIIQRVVERNFLLVEEQKWLNMIKPEEKKFKYYNLNTDVSNPWWNDEETRLNVGDKISRSRTGKKYGKRHPSIGEKISTTHKKRGIRPSKQPSVPPMLGKKHSEETKGKIRQSRLGKPGIKGRTMSESQRQEISLRQRRSWDERYGKDKADKLRENRRLKMIGNSIRKK